MIYGVFPGVADDLFLPLAPFLAKKKTYKFLFCKSFIGGR